MIKKNKKTDSITAEQIVEICQRLSDDKRVRRTLPRRGRVHIDRQLPFLVIYRFPSDREDFATHRLVRSGASYLVAPDDVKLRKDVRGLIQSIVETMSNAFGAFLLIEIWSADDEGRADDPAVPTVLPKFTVHAAKESRLTRTLEELEKRLRRIKILKHGVEVDVLHDGRTHHPGMRPLMTEATASKLNCYQIGVALPPVYRTSDGSQEYPLVLRSLRRSLDVSIRHACYQFSRLRTKHRPAHYHELGRQAVVKAVWEVDRQLAAVSDSFDYLLQLTPVNCNDAFKRFRREHCNRVPEFHYRPQPIDPILLQRQLYNIPIERVEDPVLQRLFMEKQAELGMKIMMLGDRDTKRFLYESLQLFGGVSDELFQLAKDLLQRAPMGRPIANARKLNAEQFAARVREECAYYQAQCAGFTAGVRIASDVTGLIVSRGKLLINADLSLPPGRVQALLSHEVGTHLLTYYNGRLQPFRQLYSGLAGYEELQEGLAVLSEYLVGGLSGARMRQLAARVVAIRHMIDGASFVETFRELDRTYQFAQKQAYTITMRVYRGGGLTKDAVYLRGLCDMLRYVQKGGELAPLFAGKMAMEHIPIIRELQYRKVLPPAPLEPRYMQSEQALQRLQQLRGTSLTVLDLVSQNPD